MTPDNTTPAESEKPDEGKIDAKPDTAEKPAEKVKKASKPKVAKTAPADVIEKFAEETKTVVEDVPLEDIEVGANVRTELPKMDEMTASVKSKGVIQPGVGMRQKSGKIKLVAGFRRFFGSKEAGRKTMPLRILEEDVFSEGEQHTTAMIENLQRVDMNPLDKAFGIQKMMNDNKWDQKRVAKELTVSDGYVSQHLALLKLPKQVQNAVKKGTIDLAHARQLQRISDEETMLDMLKLAGDLTVSQLQDKVEHIVAKEKEKAEREAAKEAKKGEPKKKKAAGEGGEGGEGDDEGDEPEKKSLAERYAEMEMEPLKKTDLREQMGIIATRMEKAKTEEARTKWKFYLAGMEIAAGLKKA